MASMCGTWTQTVALAWLVLDLTDSGTSVGLLTACQFLPVLFLGAYGGVVADRFDNRRAVLVVQTLLGLQALALATIVLLDVDQLWMLYVLAAVQGLGMAMDTPTRQSLIGQMVPNEDLPNALALNAGLMQLARIIGPAAAAALIGVVGIGVCFAVNAASYVVMIATILVLDTSTFVRRPRVGVGPAKVSDGLRYAATSRGLRDLLCLTLITSSVGVCATVVMPLLAKDTFGGGAALYGVLASSMGVGALVGATAVASRQALSKRQIVTTVGVVGVAFVATAISPYALVALVPIMVAGFANLSTGVTLNAALQMGARPDMRGRIIALYFLIAYGSNIVAGPLFGSIAEVFGPRWSFALAGLLALAAAAGLLTRWRSTLDDAPTHPDVSMAPAG